MTERKALSKEQIEEMESQFEELKKGWLISVGQCTLSDSWSETNLQELKAKVNFNIATVRAFLLGMRTGAGLRDAVLDGLKGDKNPVVFKKKMVEASQFDNLTVE